MSMKYHGQTDKNKNIKLDNLPTKPTKTIHKYVANYSLYMVIPEMKEQKCSPLQNFKKAMTADVAFDHNLLTGDLKKFS